MLCRRNLALIFYAHGRSLDEKNLLYGKVEMAKIRFDNWRFCTSSSPGSVGPRTDITERSKLEAKYPGNESGFCIYYENFENDDQTTYKSKLITPQIKSRKDLILYLSKIAECSYMCRFRVVRHYSFRPFTRE